MKICERPEILWRLSLLFVKVVGPIARIALCNNVRVTVRESITSSSQLTVDQDHGLLSRESLTDLVLAEVPC